MSDLLKSAIADAKAVRATALANAKAALEEAFTPKLQSMLSQKLQQEIQDEEDGQAPTAPVEDPVVATDTVSLSEPSAELPTDAPGAELGNNVTPPDSEPATTEPTAQVGAGAAPGGEEEESVEEYQTLGAGNPDPVEKAEIYGKENSTLSEDESYDLKTAPKGAKTVNVKADDNVAPNASAKKASVATPGGELKKSGGKAVEKATDDFPGEKSGTGKKPTGNAVKPYPNGGTKEVGSPGKNVAPNTSAKKAGTATTSLKEVDDVDIDDETLDEILKELENEVNQASPDHLDDPTMHAVPQEPKQAEYPGTAICAETEEKDKDEEINLDELLQTEAEDKKEDKEEKKEKDDEKEDKEDNKAPWMKENISLKAELTEYRNTVKYLRDRINEVNLLNAKLLYTNKLFKQSALTNEQKLRVIESFDLTKSVREAKLVYATLSESLNFGATKTTTKPAPTKSTAVVKSITEGLASKPVASTKPTKTVLTEGAEMANRFQKLAGIKVSKQVKL